jgi:PKHD-type hydroxylase
MWLQVPKVLSAAQVAHCRQRLAGASWADGRITAGHQSAQVKRNLQLPQQDPVALELAPLVREALANCALFIAAALPRQIFAPLFNRYGVGNGFGNHIDNAIRYDRSVAPALPVRTDLSVTLFLSEPHEYDGGELVMASGASTQHVKLSAGDLVLYPATTVHRVEPVTRGERVSSFFWVQSLVRDSGQRQLLFDLDLAIQKLNTEALDTETRRAALVELVGVYHNLLRRWSDV